MGRLSRFSIVNRHIPVFLSLHIGQESVVIAVVDIDGLQDMQRTNRLLLRQLIFLLLEFTLQPTNREFEQLVLPF